VRVDGVPYDQGRNINGSVTPTAIVLHRTYGSWPGDYNVGKNGRSDSPGIGFHFLVGKASRRWVQFYDTSQKTGHAKGANSWSVGIEFEGRNEESLTDWQVAAAATIIAAVSDTHRIPRTYYDGPRAVVSGCLAHASVPGSDHTDRISREDWNRIAAQWAAPPVVTPPQPPVDWAAVRRLSAASMIPAVAGMPDLPPLVGDGALYICALQKALNLVTGTQLPIMGIYDQATTAAVLNFQKVINGAHPGAITDFPGATHAKTRFFLVLALQAIAAGG
jgi:hypothetical protein